MFIIIATVAIIGPIMEEVIYRGYLLLSIERSLGKHAAVLLSSFWWALFHERTGFMAHLLLGLILAGLFVRNRSLIPPLMVHVILNTYAILRWLFPSVF
jgi:membrane protease YdiL (CAAX protease family)